MNKRIILGLYTLPLASIIAIIALVLRGQLGEVIPFENSEAWANNVVQPLYLMAQRLYIISYTLPLFGLWAIYAYLAEDDNAERLAFWGFIFGLFGTALALPTLGALAYSGPGFGQLFLQGVSNAPQLMLNIAMQDSMPLGIAAAIFYTLSYVLIGIAIIRSRGLSNTLALIIIPHGAFLSFGFALYPLIYLSWLSLLVGGIWLIGHAYKKSSR